MTDVSEPAKKITCMNCGADIVGKFCTRCGQKDSNLARPIWMFFEELDEIFFSVDSKLWNTLVSLLLRPGHLTRSFNRGERARWIPPLRLYLLTSILFFLALAPTNVAIVKLEASDADATQSDFNISFDQDKEVAALNTGPEIPADEPAAGDVPAVAPEEPPTRFQEALDDIRAELPADMSAEDRARVEKVLGRVSSTVREGARAVRSATPRAVGDPDVLNADLNDRPMSLRFFAPISEDDEPFELPAGILEEVKSNENVPEYFVRVAQGLETFARDPQALNDRINDWVPRIMVILLPVFAILVRIMYWQRKHVLFNQVIFSLHYHAFMFTVLTILVISVAIWGDAVPGGWFAAVIPIYLFIAMKNVFGEGWIRTTFKFLTLSFFYSIFLWSAVLGIVLQGLTEI